MFKTLRYFVFGLVSGALAMMLLLREKPRRSRTLEEMSPLYKEERATKRTLYDVDEEDYARYVTGYINELIQPDMTELEAERVRNEIYEFVHDAGAYDEMRSSRKRRERDARSKQWTDELEEGE